jgi:hypothetical protein
VADIYSIILKVFEPVLFGLIGTETDLSQLKANTVLYGVCPGYWSHGQYAHYAGPFRRYVI